jgi:predicted phosphodiesterase
MDPETTRGLRARRDAALQPVSPGRSAHLSLHVPLPALSQPRMSCRVPQAANKVDAVIYGHSHQPKIETKNGTLFFNPGSAGPRRFRLPITVGRMTAEHGKLRAEIVELSVER